MKQVSLLFISWLLAAFSYKAMAQESELKDKKKSEEIIIRKNGDKDVSMTIQINGDKVLINGKPINEFKDDNVSVNIRKMMTWNASPDIVVDGMDMGDFNFNMDGGSKVVLGVSTEKSEDGAVITDVTEGSAAAKAGLKEGDIITKFADTKINDSQELYDAVNKKNPNDEVSIEIKRDGKSKTVKAVLQERKN